MKKIIGVVMVAVCVLLVGCGQSAQEKEVEQQQKAQERLLTHIQQYQARAKPIPLLNSAPPEKVIDWNTVLLKPTTPNKPVDTIKK